MEAHRAQGAVINGSNKIQQKPMREIRRGRKTYSSESWRCWKSCHDRVVRGFFDKFLQRGKNREKVKCNDFMSHA